jgi:peroxiredoxin
MGAGRQLRMLSVGDAAPDFELRSLDGDTATLKQVLADGPALLAFFKASCPVCQLTFPFLERFHEGAAPGTLRVIGISQDGTEDTRNFNRQYGVKFPTLLDTKAAGYPASNDYGLSHVPSAFLVEPNGSISWTMEGFRKQDLEELGSRVRVTPFKPGEKVPEWKSG